jgi:hypothetical protein
MKNELVLRIVGLWQNEAYLFYKHAHIYRQKGARRRRLQAYYKLHTGPEIFFSLSRILGRATQRKNRYSSPSTASVTQRHMKKSL